jgi:hypothetical protein
MTYLASLVLFLFSLAGIGAGVFLFVKPLGAIEMQRRFYEKINWRIEPISVPKEIRNTKIMGLILSAVSLLAICSMMLVK